MELYAKYTPTFHRSGKRASVFTLRHGTGSNGRSVGVGKVDEAVLRNPSQQERRSFSSKIVPAYMRRFHRQRKMPALPRKQSQPACCGRFLTGLEQPLHTHANTEERNIPANRLRNRPAHPARSKNFGRCKVAHSR